jgi:hypothetical protein
VLLLRYALTVRSGGEKKEKKRRVEIRDAYNDVAVRCWAKVFVRTHEHGLKQAHNKRNEISAHGVVGPRKILQF